MDCTVINDGKDTLSLISNNSFDVLILDLAMSGFSGFSVLEELEKEDLLKSTNIIVLTATPITHREEDLLKRYGVKEIMKKPADMTSLIKILEIYA